MEHNTGKRAADTILQNPVELQIGGKVYNVAPPSTATLIMVSKEIASLPQVQLTKQHIAEDSLYIAKDCEQLGDILAILIIGAKKIKSERKRWWMFWKRDIKKTLSKKILEELSPVELAQDIYTLTSTLQLGDFFGLTTFLIEVNLLRQTKVETETTASGQ